MSVQRTAWELKLGDAGGAGDGAVGVDPAGEGIDERDGEGSSVLRIWVIDLLQPVAKEMQVFEILDDIERKIGRSLGSVHRK
jgi:hypothetical protein